MDKNKSDVKHNKKLAVMKSKPISRIKSEDDFLVATQSAKGMADYVKVVETQSDRVIEKFGGAYQLSKALDEVGFKKAPSSIYRWSYSKRDGGCDGFVPSNAWSWIFKAARLYGLIFSAEDLDPRPKTILKTKYIGEKDAMNLLKESTKEMEMRIESVSEKIKEIESEKVKLIKE